VRTSIHQIAEQDEMAGQGVAPGIVSFDQLKQLVEKV
jgi:hypothetical protein